jgi:hypothetical protein
MDGSFFFFTCAVPLVVLTLFAHKTTKEFVELYNKKIDSKQIFSPEQVSKKYGNNNMKFILDSPKGVFTMYKIIFFTRYSDPELNRKVNIIRMYFLASCLILVLNFIISVKTLH